MKKLLFAVATFAPLAFVSQAFAAGTINPCDNAPANSALAQICKSKDQSLGSVIGFVVTIMFVIAVLIALFFLLWGGLKWITSGGDKAGVETARNQIIAAVIGLIVVFLAFFILNLVLGLFGMNLFNLVLPTLSGS